MSSGHIPLSQPTTADLKPDPRITAKEKSNNNNFMASSGAVDLKIIKFNYSIRSISLQ